MVDQPSVISGALKQPFAEQVVYFRAKLGNLVPTANWQDLQGQAHDCGFMVAGAAKADLLTDLAAAVDRSITEGQTLEAFRKDFLKIANQRGWSGFTGDDSPARRAWRTRVIYSTNASTSYNAGRYAQLVEGGFALWVYHHNDSVSYPRPHHVAWDGITLPAGHAFWQTHYTPNGWGCRCYITGASSASGARRLGGDPDLPLPEGWDTIDPKTGVPAGIDKGWDYAPGASVATEVSKMAAKTVQWDYQLAKAYMQELPNRDALAMAYRALPSVADDTRRYAQRILEGRTHLEIPPYRTMGLLTSEDAAKVAKLTGENVDGYDWAIDQYAPRHIFNEHGEAGTEFPRGQRPVTVEDYGALPSILNAPDLVTVDGGEIVVEKMVGGNRYVTIWRPLVKRKMMNLVSMRIFGK